MSKAERKLNPVPKNSLLLTILVPAHNAGANIRPTLNNIAEALRSEGIPFELLVVNDGSTDNTALVVEATLQTEVPEIRIVHSPAPSGLGRAIRFGLNHFRGDAVAIVMADCSDHPNDVVRCYRKIEEGYDAAFGSRFIPGAQATHYPLGKLVINRTVNKMMQLLFMTHHNDLTNAFKIYRRYVIESITPLHAAHFNITIEMSLSTLIRRYQIASLPISWSGTAWAQSELSLFKMGRGYLCTLLMIWCERILILDDLILETLTEDERKRLVPENAPKPH